MVTCLQADCFSREDSHVKNSNKTRRRNPCPACRNRSGFIRLLMLVLALFIIAGGSLQASAVEYDTTCNNCGHDNPQWLLDDYVKYCEECGALGMVVEIHDETTEAEPEEDAGPDADSNDADDWSDDEDEKVPFEVVVGGGAAVGAAVILILKNAAKGRKTGKTASRDQTPVAGTPGAGKPSTGKPKRNDGEPAGYILKLSQERILCKTGVPGRVVISVLKVDARGVTSLEPSAPIQVMLPPNSILRADPPTGFGEITVTVSQICPSTSQEPEWLQVTAQVPGAQKIVHLAVDLERECRMVFF